MQKKTENVGSKMLKTKNGRTIFLSNVLYVAFSKSRIMKEREPKGLLIRLSLKKIIEQDSITR